MLHTPDRRRSDSAKWTRHAVPGRDILPFWVADMDFTSPPEVIAAIQQRAGHGVFGYADAPASCLEAVLEYLLDTHGVKAEPDWIVWLPGMVPGLAVAGRATCAPGEETIITPPVYPPFFTAPGDDGRVVVKAPLAFDESTGYRLSVEAIEAAITAKTRMLLLCHPHNPVGRVFTEDELRPVRELCASRGIVLCSDEIHCDLILNQSLRHQTAIAWEGENGLRTITLHAPSKTYNIAGLGLSYAVIPDPALRRAFARAKRGPVPDPNLFSYTAAEAAYRHGRPWLDQVLALLRQNRDTARAALDALPGLRTFPLDATYLLWIDARGMGIENPHAHFLENADVFFSDGRDFGAPGFLRMNLGCAPDVLADGLSRIAAAM